VSTAEFTKNVSKLVAIAIKGNISKIRNNYEILYLILFISFGNKSILILCNS